MSAGRIYGTKSITDYRNETTTIHIARERAKEVVRAALHFMSRLLKAQSSLYSKLYDSSFPTFLKCRIRAACLHDP